MIYSLEQIREYWADQAKCHGQAPAASWSDHRVIDMEIREIIRHLEDGDRVLDVGCANGHSTVQFAAQRRISIRGVDYIPGMVEQARLRLPGLSGHLMGDVEFDVGDITQLDEPTGHWDKVVVVRVVINLGDWENQLRGMRECLRVLRPGGLLILSEATIQGWEKLNSLRREWGIPDIPMPPFNRYLDESRVVDALSQEADLVDLVNFASTYYVGTRVLKPLLAKALGGGIDVASPDSEWNAWFSHLPAWGDCGTQKMFLLRKR